MPMTDEELAGAAYVKASEAPSDPLYNQDVRDKLNAILNVGDDVAAFDLIEGDDAHIKIRLRNPRNLSAAREVATELGNLFGRPVVFVGREVAHDSRVREFDDAPQHTFYNDHRRQPGVLVREYRTLPKARK